MVGSINHKQEIKELKELVKVRVAMSDIHGVGLFALRDIKQGEKLYADFFPRVYTLPYKKFRKLPNYIREEILGKQPSIIDGKRFVYPTCMLQTFINHSDDPNYDVTTDRMIRDIKAGEEITEDYTQITQQYKKIYTFLKK